MTAARCPPVCLQERAEKSRWRARVAKLRQHRRDNIPAKTGGEQGRQWRRTGARAALAEAVGKLCGRRAIGIVGENEIQKIVVIHAVSFLLDCSVNRQFSGCSCHAHAWVLAFHG